MQFVCLFLKLWKSIAHNIVRWNVFQSQHVEPHELFKSRGTIRTEHYYKIGTVPLAPNKLQRSQKDNSLNVKTFTLVKFGKTIFPIQFGLPFRRYIKTNEWHAVTFVKLLFTIFENQFIKLVMSSCWNIDNIFND